MGDRLVTAVLVLLVLACPLAAGLVFVIGSEALVILVASVVAAVLLPPRIWPDESRARGLIRIAIPGLLAFVLILPSWFASYVVSISAGLCGDLSSFHLLALVPYFVVGAWGFRRGALLHAAWPLAVPASVAVFLLISYVDPGAHAQCET
jgi:hypothetical protein